MTGSERIATNKKHTQRNYLEIICIGKEISNNIGKTSPKGGKTQLDLRSAWFKTVTGAHHLRFKTIQFRDHK